MTETALDRTPRSRSLWSDAWRRLKANRAAYWSGIFLLGMIVGCVFGPFFTGHAFNTIYQDYVRVPPSLTPYPKPEMVGSALEDAVRRARVTIEQWQLDHGEIIVAVTAAQPIDGRVTRYLDRSSTFENARVVERSADGRRLVMMAAIEQHYFLFGTDPSGRDLLTRTLVAGRVSLAVGIFGGIVSVLIGVVYGGISGLAGGRIDEIMMRIVDILYALPFVFFVIMLVVFFGRHFMLMFLGIAAVLWLDMARIVRGQTLSIKRQEYVQAAEALGVDSTGILWRHPATRGDGRQPGEDRANCEEHDQGALCVT